MIPSFYTLLLTKYTYICNLYTQEHCLRRPEDNKTFLSRTKEQKRKEWLFFFIIIYFCIDLKFFNNSSTLIDAKSQ